jgi:SH3-like domain-containing protein
MRHANRALFAMIFVACASGLGAASAQAQSAGSASGLPVPRFVSLKADKVNMHIGPAKTYETKWLYQRAGLPVEITAEFENWRRIRDWEGAEGWVYHSLLSGKRTALVSPQSKGKDELLSLHDKPEAASAASAKLQHGVLATVKRCKDGWCRLVGEGFDGWIEQPRLWGVYPGEKVD